MHIGFETVNLKGQYFISAISKNDIICRGQVLAEFDIDGIKKAGYSVTTPVVISNSKKTGRVLPGHDFKAGERSTSPRSSCALIRALRRRSLERTRGRK